MAKIERLRLPDQLPQPISHYTDAVVADGWIWVSGMLALDATGALIGADDVVEQAERVTHAAVRGTGQQHQGVIIACDALHTRNLLQLVPNLYLRNLFEIELQAS